jgi:hypothetical protein
MEKATIKETQENKITVISCSAKQLFDGLLESINMVGQLKIPEYQRPYVWQEKQLNQLATDLNSFYETYNDELPLYYLGSIILHKDNNNLNIIDGQQRITTLALFDYYRNNKEHKIEYSSPKSISQIKKNYELLCSKMIDLKELNLDLLNITLVITNSEDDAYTFFETQNTGGKRLSGSDIVKAHHLRAVKGNGAIANKAMQWESKNINSINEVIGLLTKARYWNFLEWKSYPSFRHVTAIKNVIVEDFTKKTINSDKPKSFYQTEVLENNFEKTTKNSSPLKAIRQPLFNGSHFIDYVSDYVDIYEDLFLVENNYLIDIRFYEFRNNLITGNNGTVFLKELFQLVVITYVSKFGLENIYEFSLWAFRYVYATRVINRRTVREDSIEKFVREEVILDKILNCFTHEDVINKLKKYHYDFNNENCESNKVKGRFINSLGCYFPSFSNGIVTDNFDIKLKKDIDDKF